MSDNHHSEEKQYSGLDTILGIAVPLAATLVIALIVVLANQ